MKILNTKITRTDIYLTGNDMGSIKYAYSICKMYYIFGYNYRQKVLIEEEIPNNTPYADVYKYMDNKLKIYQRDEKIRKILNK